MDNSVKDQKSKNKIRNDDNNTIKNDTLIILLKTDTFAICSIIKCRYKEINHLDGSEFGLLHSKGNLTTSIKPCYMWSGKLMIERCLTIEKKL